MSFQTPMRPVPGAFLNTPAVASKYQTGQDPTRRQLFPPSESSGSLQQVPQNAPLPPSQSAPGGLGGGMLTTNPLPPPRSEAVPPVIKAARAVNDFLQSDENFPDVDSYIRRKCFEETKGSWLTWYRGCVCRIRAVERRFPYGTFPQDTSVSNTRQCHDAVQ